MFNVYCQFCPFLLFVIFGVSPGCIAEPVRKVVIEEMACQRTSHALNYNLPYEPGSECKIYLGSVQILVIFPMPK